MFKRTLLIALFFSLYFTSFSQNLNPSDPDSKINFVIKNLGISVDGSLKGLKGHITFNPKKPTTSLFDVTVDANTINTNNTKRDNHLKTDDFFDVKKYPTIRIKSTSIQSKGNNVYFAKAVLTMHGVSKNIQFDFVAKPASGGYRFIGAFTIDRRDYKVGGYSLTMSDDVKVSLDVVAKK